MLFKIKAPVALRSHNLMLQMLDISIYKLEQDLDDF